MSKKQIIRLIIAAAVLLGGIILIICGVMHWETDFEFSFKLTPDEHPAELYHLVTEATALKPGSYTLTLNGDLGAGNGTQSAVRVDDIDGEILFQEVLSGGEENTFEFKIPDRIRQIRIRILYDPASGVINVRRAVISTDNVVYRASAIRQAVIAVLFTLLWIFLIFRYVFPKQYREFIATSKQKIIALEGVSTGQNRERLNEDGRNSAMDLLRNIAILMVICIHDTNIWKYGEAATFKWHVSEVWHVICRSAVPLFFMMSGAFYKDAPVSKTVKKIIKFTGIFFGISLLYTLSDAYWRSISGGGEIRAAQIINGILNYKYHLWYLPAYVYVLSIAPILVKIIDRDNGRLTEYLLGIWIVFGIIANSLITAVEGFENYDLYRKYIKFFSSLVFLSGNHIGYFILGRYLSKKNYIKKARYGFYTLGLLSTAALYFLTDWYSHYSGLGDNRWNNTLNIFVLLQAISLFILFSNITVTGKHARLASRLSKYTFGIYLIHVLFLDWGFRLKFFTESGIGNLEINPILNIPLQVILIYLMSLACTFIVKKIGHFLKAHL